MSKDAGDQDLSEAGRLENDSVEEMAQRLERRLAEAASGAGPEERPDMPDLGEAPVGPPHGGRERRREPRIKTLKDGRILTRRLEGGIDCLILDISASGARLKPLRSFVAPKAFALVFPDGALRICETVWQGDVTLGVRYLD